MMQELATARVLSVALPSHYAFVAISVAMFGIGLGGLLVFLLPNTFRADRVDRQAVAYLACFGVAAAVADFAFLHLHVVQALSWAGFVTLSAAYIVLAVPFLCAGLCIAILMTHFARRMATLYAADLLGAALGCGAAVAVLGMVPAPLVPLVVCAVATVAALVLASPRFATVAAALAAGVLLVVGFGSDAFRMRYVKGWQGHNPETGWLMVFRYEAANQAKPTQFVQILAAKLSLRDWSLAERGAAITKDENLLDQSRRRCKTSCESAL